MIIITVEIMFHAPSIFLIVASSYYRRYDSGLFFGRASVTCR